MSPVETVKAIYAAFGRGDIRAIVDAMSEDVVWEYAYTAETHSSIPWLTPRRGKSGVQDFFQALGGGLKIEHFQVNAVFGEASCVVALIDLDARAPGTGARIVERDEVHVWHFDAAGKVARFRHASDTLQHFRAATGAR